MNIEVAASIGGAIADAIQRAVQTIEDNKRAHALFGYIGLQAAIALHEVREEVVRHINGKDSGDERPLPERIITIINESVPWLEELLA